MASDGKRNMEFPSIVRNYTQTLLSDDSDAFQKAEASFSQGLEDGMKARARSFALTEIAPLGLLAKTQLVLEAGASVQYMDCFAFREACRFGHLEVAQLLHQAGADPRSKDDYAIGLAAEMGHLDVCRWLVSVGADAAADDCYALSRAATFGHKNVVEWLLDPSTPAGPSGPSKPLVSVITGAAGNGQAKIVDMLLDKAAPKTEKAKENWFARGGPIEGAIAHAAVGYHVNVLERILQRIGLQSIELKYKEVETPLPLQHLAISAVAYCAAPDTDESTAGARSNGLSDSDTETGDEKSRCDPPVPVLAQGEHDAAERRSRVLHAAFERHSATFTVAEAVVYSPPSQPLRPVRDPVALIPRFEAY